MQKYYYMMQAAHAIKLCIPGRCAKCVYVCIKRQSFYIFPRMHHPTPGGRTRPAALDLSSRWESDNNLAARSAPQREREMLHAAVSSSATFATFCCDQKCPTQQPVSAARSLLFLVTKGCVLLLELACPTCALRMLLQLYFLAFSIA
jgi:hypothetical protein